MTRENVEFSKQDKTGMKCTAIKMTTWTVCGVLSQSLWHKSEILVRGAMDCESLYCELWLSPNFDNCLVLVEK